MQSRQDYAVTHRQQYLDWCQSVECGPATAMDKLEFAIISAHCRMDKAIAGWAEHENDAPCHLEEDDA